MKVILFIYLVALGVKAYAYHVSGFTAILGDVFHSVIDISMILILIFSERFSRRAGDKTHPFGHGLAKNVASLAVGVGFITFMFFELMKEGILKIVNPSAEYRNFEVAISAEIVVLLLLLLAAGISARRSGILNRTLLVESLNDSLSTVAAIMGVFLVWAGYVIFDGVATILIALIILYNSVKLVKENAKVLLGMSPSDEFYKSVENTCLKIDRVNGIHDMVGIYTGENSIHLDMHVTVDGSMTVKEADKLSFEIARAVMDRHPEVKHVSIHFCPHHGERRKIYASEDVSDRRK